MSLFEFTTKSKSAVLQIDSQNQIPINGYYVPVVIMPGNVKIGFRPLNTIEGLTKVKSININEDTVTIDGVTSTATTAKELYDEIEALFFLGNTEFSDTEQAARTLDHFIYNPVTDKLEADKPIETTLSSLYLGEQHRMSSGGENVFFTNESSQINWYPMWGGLKDMSIAENKGEAGIIKPSARNYSNFSVIEINGPVDTGVTDAINQAVIPVAVSGIGADMVIEDTIIPSDTLYYNIYYGTDGNDYGNQAFESKKRGLTLNPGDAFEWIYEHPVETKAGQPIYARIDVESADGTVRPLQVRKAVNGAMYVAIQAFSFTDDDIALKSDVEAIVSGSVYKGAYDADTDTPTLTLDSTEVNGDYFRVSVSGGAYEVGDLVIFNGTTTSYDHIPVKSLTQELLETSPLKIYNTYVKANFVGATKNGSALYPYSEIQTAVDAASDGDSIFLDGEFNIAIEITLPSDKSLTFVGANNTTVQYASYSTSNGDVMSFDGDSTKTLIFKDITFKNAGGYGLLIKNTEKVELRKCKFFNNGWDGTQLHTAVSKTLTGLLGYDSTQAELQAFYAGSHASNGGALRLENCRVPLVRECRAENNLRGLRIQDCGINGGGFVIENQSLNNIESGIYIAAGALGGCQNVTVTINYSSYNANNGLLCIGGINNKFSQNEVNGNWNAGFCAWGAANSTLRDCGLYDNNRSVYNGIGNTGDAKASIQINEAYNLLGTQISLNPAFRFIAEILDTQVHYTGLGSNTDKVGFLITSGVGALPDNPKNIIKVDDVGFIGQDYAIDLSEVDVTNLRLSLGDNSYQSIGVKAVKAPLNGNYSELPFSNHVMEVPEVDVVVDTLKQTIALHEGVGGNVINVYNMNEIQSVLKTNSVDIIQKSSDKIQLRDCTLGNTYINGVVAGSNLNTMNDSLNAAFSMNLTQYKEFIETGVGVVGAGDSATFYYIESPDGVYHYPLFKTETEANLIDTELGGTGSSHTHTYADDLTNTTWYMPDVSNHMSSSVMPVNGLYTAPNGGEIESVVWNIQTTDDDANYLPTFSNITYDVQEGSAINIQYKAAGMTDTFNVTNVPNGYADNGFAIVGTAEDISNGYGQSIQHVLNVTKANAFGSVQGTITINVKANLSGNEFTIIDKENGTIKFTQDGGITELDFNTVTFNAGSTYKFYLDHYSIESSDGLSVVDSSGNILLGSEGLSNSGNSGDAGAYMQYVIPTDVSPGKFLRYYDNDTSAYYTDVPMTLAGSTYTANPTGITLEGPAANQTGSNVMDQYDHGWISLNETLGTGERLVFDNAFFSDFFGEFMDTNNIFAIGLKGDNFTNTKEINSAGAASSGEFFKGNIYIVGVCTSGGSQVNMAIIANGQQGNTMVLNSASLRDTFCAFLEVTGSGNNIRTAFGRNGSNGVTAGSESTTTYGNWNSQKGQTGEQGYGITNLDVVMAFWTYNGGDIDGDEIDWTGLTEISIPTPSTSSITPFTKAIDFSTSTSAYLDFQGSDSRWPLLKLPARTVAAHSSDATLTSNASAAEPFLTSCVFQPGTTGPSDNYGDQSGGRIWWAGQGGSIDKHNIMLEQKGNDIFFSWGKVMAQWPNRTQENQIRVIENADPTKWYGVYIAHRGHRSSSPSAADLGAMFDIYVMSSDDSFAALGSNISTASEWGESWNETGHSITGGMTSSANFGFGGLGGSSSIYSFSGKIASFVCHPLFINAAMPDATEIKKVIVDPLGFSGDMIGTSQVNYNRGGYTYTGYNTTSGLSTQIYLFGDGTNDSFTNKIRNQANNLDTYYTPLVFNNMQASDIVNVSINGLS